MHLFLIMHHAIVASGATTTTQSGTTTTSSNGYSLPTSTPVNPLNTVLGNLILTTMNWVLGVFGFFVIAYGMYRFLTVIWNQYRGKKDTNSDYTHGFIGNVGSTAPKVLMAGVDVMVGIVIVGMFLSGAWVDIANALIHMGSHIGITISNQIGNS
jgi:hypothetical protein